MKEIIDDLGSVGPREFINRLYEDRALPRSEPCEKCGKATRYQVKIILDRWASWCGCGNMNYTKRNGSGE